ncbi:MAG: prepilin-type N-terminal cleavage/methylation domain-containing protein [Candidatus Spyradenecus sp.]
MRSVSRFPASLREGFTLIEILVVIVIIGVLGGLGMGGYSYFIEQARKKNAADMCAQIATAWTNFHRDLTFWPDEYKIGSSGVKEMDTDMCLVLGKGKYLDVLYIDSDSPAGLKRNKENEAELKYGMLDPIGERLFKRNPRSAKIKEHLYQFCLDVNEDGIVDGSDGMPANVLQGKKIRGDAAVWCWPEDEAARSEGDVYAKSW